MSSPTERLSFLPDFPGRESLYRPLDAEKVEIRVITVEPSRDRSSAIRCVLQTISIKNGRSTVPYDAISYFWGSTAITENVIVYDKSPTDGHRYCSFEVPVTVSLASALRQLRARATQLNEPLVLWTDAFCIHRLDAAERSQQVTIMRRIYEAATLVPIWLGDGDPKAEAGLVNIFGLAMYQQAYVADRDRELDAFDYYNFDADPDLESLKLVDALFKTYGDPDGYDIRTEVEHMDPAMIHWTQTVYALLDLSHWYRGWTLQEACANKNIMLQYGQTRCRIKRWESLRDVLFSVHISRRLCGPGGKLALEEFQWWVQIVIWAHRSAEVFESTVPLPKESVKSLSKHGFTILARSRRQTSDPRDQIYSLYGSFIAFKFLIKPDYTLTTEQVFVSTTIAMLEASQSWTHDQFLVPSKSPFLPYWAIDCTLAPDEEVTILRSIFKRGSFNADLNGSFRMQESQSGSLLTAGFIHDDVVIVESCNRLGHEGSFIECLDIIIHKTEDSQYFFSSNTSLTGMDLWESVCRTLCMGMVGRARFGPQHAAACRHWWFGRDELLGDDWRSVSFELWVKESYAQSAAMNFIVTRYGYLGLAPRNVNVGDSIAILATGALPYILRKVGRQENQRGTYTLLGACYVDGIMYGEAIRERARSIHETRRLYDSEFLLWKRRHRELVNWDMNLGEMSLSSDLAFQDSICLV